MRYLLGFLGVIGLVVVVIVLIIRGLTGDDPIQDGPQLTDYTHTGTIMRLTIDEPINSEQEHQAVRITVSRSESRIETLQGYQRQVTEGRSFPSNAEAYGVFLRALDLLNFDRGSDNPSLEDPRGYCPEGNLYTYEIIDGNSQLQSYWRTSCGEGSFGGEIGDVTDLFQAQIPNYGQFVRNIDL